LARRVALARHVGEHMDDPRRGLADDQDAAFVRLRARLGGRIDADDNLDIVGRRGVGGKTLALDQRARPQRARRLLDDLGEQFLPPDRATGVARRDAIQKRPREMMMVVEG